MEKTISSPVMGIIRRLKDDLSLPFIGIILFSLLYCVTPLFLGHELPQSAEALAVLLNYLGLSWWLIEDARRLRFKLPMEYGFLMIIFSPIFLFYYLFKTRGWMAFFTLGPYLVSIITIGVIYYFLATFLYVD